jgi:hypothetical protein
MVGKIIKRTIRSMRGNPKNAKQTRVINPFAKDLPTAMAKKKFQSRPVSRTRKTPLGKAEQSARPLRKAKYRYGGR